MSGTRPQGRLRGLALVGAGGFTGAVLRWLLDGWLGTAPTLGGLPVGTLAANVLASFLLGLLLSEARITEWLGPETRLLVGTGFCGSLSTYSTFAAETATIAPPIAGGYVLATYALGFLAVLAGDLLGRWAA
jgi:CrcB protein